MLFSLKVWVEQLATAAAAGAWLGQEGVHLAVAVGVMLPLIMMLLSTQVVILVAGFMHKVLEGRVVTVARQVESLVGAALALQVAMAVVLR